MAVNTPTANAIKLNVYDKTIYIWMHVIFDSQSGLRCVLEQGNEFSFIDEALMETTLMTTREKTDEIFKQALEQINTSLKKVFGGSSNEPELGLERIDYLVHRLVVVDNKVTIN